MKPFGLLVLLIAVSGCGHSAAESRAGTVAVEADARVAPIKVGVALDGTTMNSPLRVAVALDKTGSSEPNGVSSVTVDDFSALIGLIRNRGGELAVGLIQETSNRPLLRLRIEPPETEGTPGAETNPYRRAEMQSSQRHKDSIRAKELDDQITNFKRDLAARTSIPANAQRTALCEAIQRVDLFLQEESAWRDVQRFAVFVTDGEDNVAKSPCSPMKSDSRLILIKGVGELGAFKNWSPLVFESPRAAFSWIESTQ